MSEEPLFDPSLKKRKKKAVAFIEDPLGAEADPTTPAPATIESTTVTGEKVDMGEKTAHEAMQKKEDKAGAGDKLGNDMEDVNGAKDKDAGGDDDDVKAMFGDLKKKKKKKDIPLDLVNVSRYLLYHVYLIITYRILLLLVATTL
jgi:translation initiation factor 2 subunit 2